MELLQFRYFLEAARYENLTRAADELHIAQPALSQSIMRLENELGVKLFDRRNHHVYLNDQGKLLRKRLIPLMESIDSLKDELWESVCSSEKTISLNFFAASQFITNGWQLRQICDNFFHQAGVRPQMIFESNSPESVRNLIAAGLGIGFWPERSWDEQPGPQVKLIPIRYPVCRRDVVVTMYKQAQEKPVVGEFVDYLCGYFKRGLKDEDR